MKLLKYFYYALISSSFTLQMYGQPRMPNSVLLKIQVKKIEKTEYKERSLELKNRQKLGTMPIIDGVLKLSDTSSWELHPHKGGIAVSFTY